MHFKATSPCLFAGSILLGVLGWLTTTGAVQAWQVAPQPEKVLHKKSPFKDQKTIKPNDQFTYQLKIAGNVPCYLNIKPQLDAILEIKVYQDGKIVAQDQGLKTNFVFHWKPKTPGTVYVRIRSLDTLTSLCNIQFYEAGDEGPPAPGIAKAYGPFKHVKTIDPKQLLTYLFPVDAGRCIFSIEAPTPTRMDIKVAQDGVLVARDTNGPTKKAFKLDWNSTTAAYVSVQINGKELLPDCTISFKQIIIDPPRMTILAKPNSFTDSVSLKPGDRHVWKFPIMPGRAHLHVGAHYPEKLEVNVYSNGILVAKHSGTEGNHVLRWDQADAGEIVLHLQNTDILPNTYSVAFTRGKPILAPPAPGGLPKPEKPALGQLQNFKIIDKKFGDFTEDLVLQPGEQIIYTFPVTKAQVYFKIKPQGNANLEVKVYLDRELITEQGGQKDQFGATLNPLTSGQALVLIKNLGQWESNCKVSTLTEQFVPPPGLKVMTGPFTLETVLQPNSPSIFLFPVKPGKCIFTIKAMLKANLNVVVKQKGTTLAKDQGLKDHFIVTWEATTKGTVEVWIVSEDLTGICTISFKQPLPDEAPNAPKRSLHPLKVRAGQNG
jgi:hypothetical protein